jgi:hypothetical protein
MRENMINCFDMELFKEFICFLGNANTLIKSGENSKYGVESWNVGKVQNHACMIPGA